MLDDADHVEWATTSASRAWMLGEGAMGTCTVRAGSIVHRLWITHSYPLPLGSPPFIHAIFIIMQGELYAIPMAYPLQTDIEPWKLVFEEALVMQLGHHLLAHQIWATSKIRKVGTIRILI